MRISYIFLITALALSTTISAANDPTIPKSFLGEWNADISQCGKGTDESFLLLEPHRVSFWESTGPVIAAFLRGNELALILELSGEGEVWLSATKFELSLDGSTLTSETIPGEEFVRYRCPTSASAP